MDFNNFLCDGKILTRLLRACLAEGCGTFLMVLCGTGAVFAAVTTGALTGLWQVAVIWGVVIALAIQATGAVSGAHLNPAVTLALCVWRGFPAARVPAYLLAQLAGAFAASALLYGLYGGVLAGFEQREGLVRGQPGSERSAMVFGEYFPNPDIFRSQPNAHQAVSLSRAMAAEGLGTAVLVFCLFALTDRRNPGRPRGALLPAGIGLTVAVLIAVIAPLTQAGFNPARDFGPRLFAFLVGWGPVAIPGPRGGFFWVYIAAPILGGLAGAGLYDRGLGRFLQPDTNQTSQRGTTMGKTRFLLIGGFLAAGKTTALARLAEGLAADGRRAGCIVNDQSEGLVDTARLTALGLPVAEVTGGCFCCRFHALLDAVGKLAATARPDVVLAEPVGSCTDLAATVAYPLRRNHGRDYEVGPLSVLVDPTTCAQILGRGDAPAHSPDVRYIYLKQLEEADILVINKIDGLIDGERLRLAEALAKRFPQARVLAVSCLTGEGIEDWIRALGTVRLGTRPAMALDYERYAAGEALLGWYNASAVIETTAADALALMTRLARGLRDRLHQRAIPIAHLKCSLADQDGRSTGASSVTRGTGPVETTLAPTSPQWSRTLAINLRAEADPATLSLEVEAALADMPAGLRLEAIRAFRPGRPNPSHRLAWP
jgi:glycerol uptake facilitator protein